MSEQPMKRKLAYRIEVTFPAAVANDVIFQSLLHSVDRGLDPFPSSRFSLENVPETCAPVTHAEMPRPVWWTTTASGLNTSEYRELKSKLGYLLFGMVALFVLYVLALAWPVLWT